MRNKKRSGWWLGALALACIGGTAAYLTAFDQAVNTVAVGRNTTEIKEEFPTPSPIPEEGNPEYVKTVWVTNQSGGEDGFNVDCYVRVSLSYSNADIGRAVHLKDLDTANWKYHNEDGYFYYTKPLSEGESTTPLFQGFSIDCANIDHVYKDEMDHFCIHVYEESVQAGNFKDYQSAWDYYTNPVSRTRGEAVKV